MTMKRLFLMASAIVIFPASLANAQSMTGKETIAKLPNVQEKVENPLPSSVKGSVTPPLSTQKLEYSDKHVSDQLDSVQKEVDARMSGFDIGNVDKMKVPDVDSDTSLKQSIQMENDIRYTKLRSQQVAQRMGLWGATYDGPREEKDKKGNNTTGQGGSHDYQGSSENPQVPDKVSEEEREKQARFDAEQRRIQLEQQNQAEKQRMDNMLKQARDLMSQQKPVVASIYGIGTDLKADVLIPYEAQVTVSQGDEFSTYDGKILHVVEITPSTVVVNGKGGKYALNSGVSVPSPQNGQKILADIMKTSTVTQPQNSKQNTPNYNPSYNSNYTPFRPH